MGWRRRRARRAVGFVPDGAFPVFDTGRLTELVNHHEIVARIRQTPIEPRLAICLNRRRRVVMIRLGLGTLVAAANEPGIAPAVVLTSVAD